MRIPCPWCGERDLAEFRSGGEAHRARPTRPAELDDSQWAEYLFYRTNPKGQHLERWVHAWGCRQWFNVVRDTTTHEIRGAYRSGELPAAAGTPAAELATHQRMEPTA